MLRVARSMESGCVVFALSGRVDRQHAVDLETAFEREPAPIVVDLDEVRLVDRDAVPFLAGWKRHGITLRNCPGYIRAWIALESSEG
jgi:hypothetical protein